MSIPEEQGGEKLDLLNLLEQEKPKQQLQPLIPAVTNTMGKDFCVPEVKGRLEDLVKDVNKIPSDSITNAITFNMITNSGTDDPYESTLGKKIYTEKGKNEYFYNIKMINDILKKRNDKGILFIKDIQPDQMINVVGYESYTGDPADNIGFAKNPSEWSKWDDENILELARKGAEVTWYGIKMIDGKLEHVRYDLKEDPSKKTTSKTTSEKPAKVITTEPVASTTAAAPTPESPPKEEKLFDVIEKGIKEKTFSFHAVYIPEHLPIIQRILELGKKVFGDSSQPEITEAEDERIQQIIDSLGEYGTKKRTGIKEFFPMNDFNKYVVTDMLKLSPVFSIWRIGTGLMSLRGKGVHDSSYQGVLTIDDVMKAVLGVNNFIYITGTPIRIKIKSEINIKNPKDKFATPRKYKAGELFVIRGLYIDALGEFKIGQVATSISLGKDDSDSTRKATIQELVIRQMVTRAYPVFRTLSQSEYATLKSIMSGYVSLKGIERKQNMITTQLIREKGGLKILGGGKRDMIEGNEMKSLEIEDEDREEDRLRKLREDMMDMMLDYFEENWKREERRIPETRKFQMKQIAVPEDKNESIADVHYHDINGEYIGVNKEEQRKIEEEIQRNRMEEERKEGEEEEKEGEPNN